MLVLLVIVSVDLLRFVFGQLTIHQCQILQRAHRILGLDKSRSRVQDQGSIVKPAVEPTILHDAVTVVEISNLRAVLGSTRYTRCRPRVDITHLVRGGSVIIGIVPAKVFALKASIHDEVAIFYHIWRWRRVV